MIEIKTKNCTPVKQLNLLLIGKLYKYSYSIITLYLYYSI